MLQLRAGLLGLCASVLFTLPAAAADRDKIQAFMSVTGFDVALHSLRVSAKNAPAMLGIEAEAFGTSWTRLADDLFEPKGLESDALDILEQTLSDDVLAHAAGFYASDLGQRLVEAENESHFADDEMKDARGQELAAALMERDSTQIQDYIEMSEAIGSVDHSIAAYQEVQVRFIMAAAASGVIEMRFSEEELRQLLAQDNDEIKEAIRVSSLAANAYTYRDFTDEEVRAYTDALKTPEMKEVYELMNAVTYAIMADRYEEMATRMAELHPSQEL